MTSILCCISLLVSAPDTFPAADTIFIQEKRLQVASVGKNVLQFESGSGNLLSQVLASAGISIRQYGPSGIGTLSRRGADPSQLQILWNGIVLNNPMLGMTDLSLLQNDAQSRIVLTEGGSGSFYGSGSVGGTLSMQHIQPEKTGESLTSSFTMGSFGRLQANADCRIKSRKNFFIWDNQWLNVKNHFPYKIENASGANMHYAEREQRRSRISSGLHYKKWDLALHAEWQKGERGLGTSAGGTTSLGWQADENKRLALLANYQSSKVKWVQRLGFIQDNFVFQPMAGQYKDSSRSQSLQYQQEWHFTVGSWNVIAGADLWQVSGKTRAYIRQAQQLFPAQFLSLFNQNKKYRISASSRWEWHEQISVNAVSGEYALGKVVNLKSSVSSSFRRPTLNDQYWSSGGNTNLKPEKGGNAEVGFTAKWIQGNVKAEMSATLWARHLNNPIVWLPENNIWMAFNMQRGDYYGTQFSAVLSGLIGQTQWQWRSSAEWCRADMLKNDLQFKALFVPAFSGASFLKIQRKKWFLNTGCNWQSMRYTSTDNLSSLPGYALFGIQTGKEMRFKQYNLSLSAGADNIFNQSYEVMPGRPMPLRSFWLRAIFQLTHKNP